MRINYEGIKPYKKHYGDAGHDIYTPNDVVLRPNTMTKISLKFKVEIPIGYMGILLPRSGSAVQGILVQAPPIDHGYSGDIHAIVFYCGEAQIIIKEMGRICQLVIIPVSLDPLCKGRVTPGDRGEDGFNSSGE